MNIHQTIDSIKLRYEIKREYFTAGIPLLVAILLVVWAIMNGHTLSFFSSSSQQSAVDQKQEAYQQLLQQMQQEGQDVSGESTAVTATTTNSAPTPTPDLDHYLIYAALIAMTPYSIDRYLQRREKKRNEEDFTQFLFKMSELMRAGIDPIKSVIELSRTELGSLNKHIALAASAMVIGNSFEDGMGRVSKSLDNELISKYVDLIIQASNMGGSVHNLILKASEDMRAMIVIDREMEGNLKQYVLIFYFAQVILIILVYILSSQMFPYLTGSNVAKVFGGSGIGDINYQQGFFHMLIINAMFGGIIIGKITEGSAKDGLKHCVVLTIISYLVCVFIIIPAGNVQHDSINVVSGDKQFGTIGMPLSDPIKFHLEDSMASPKTNVLIQFSIQPSGTVTPASHVTDNNGDVSVQVLLGDTPGIYTVTAKEDNSTVASVNIRAVEPSSSNGGD